MAPTEQQRPFPLNRGLFWAVFSAGFLALATGLPLMAVYEPLASEAHGSMLDIERRIGWVRALHHWSSATLLFFGGVWLVSGLLRGSYRRPAHLVWLGVILTLSFGMLLQLTGHLLPWDAHAVRTAVVETGIAEAIPVVGPAQAKVLRGGDAVGPDTLRTWYWAHLLLPLAFVGAGVWAWSRLKRLGHPWPKLTWAVGAAGLIAIAAFVLPVSLGPEATAADYGSYAARPEWYVAPMHGLLTLFQGFDPALGFIGSAVIPFVAVMFLLALPWIDRQGRRSVAVASGTLLLVGLAALFLMTFDRISPLGGPGDAVAAVGGAETADEVDQSLAAQGREIFVAQGCFSCHRIGGRGENVGPDLTRAGERHPSIDWQIRHLKDPEAVVPGSTMPAYDQLSEEDLRALANYLISLKEAQIESPPVSQ